MAGTGWCWLARQLDPRQFLQRMSPYVGIHLSPISSGDLFLYFTARKMGNFEMPDSSLLSGSPDGSVIASNPRISKMCPAWFFRVWSKAGVMTLSSACVLTHLCHSDSSKDAVVLHQLLVFLCLVFCLFCFSWWSFL